MSQYLNIYLKKKDVYVELPSFLSGTILYNSVQSLVPYDSLKEIGHNDLNNMTIAVHYATQKIESHIRALEEAKKDIASYHNTIEEKMSARGDIENDLEEAREELESAKRAQYFLEMLDDIRYTEEPATIYMGIEASPNVGEEIEEDREDL